MKIFKKVCRFLLILLVAATWLNIGYWGGKSYYDANIQILKNEPLNGFQKFQLGGDKYLQINNNLVELQEKHSGITRLTTISGPLGFILSIVAWIVYGIAQTGIGIWAGITFLGVQIWHELIFLRNFFLRGGFFKLIGIYWSLMVVNFLLGIFLYRWGRKIQKRFKLSESAGKNSALASTIACGFFCSLLLIFGAFPIWWLFYFLWTILLLLSFFLNIFKE